MRLGALAGPGTTAARLRPRLTAATAPAAEPVQPELERNDGAFRRLARRNGHCAARAARRSSGATNISRTRSTAGPIDGKSIAISSAKTFARG